MLVKIHHYLNKNYKWFMLLQMWLIYYSLGMISASLPPLTTPITSELGLSYSQMGVILGTTHLIYIPLAIPVGLLIDRIGIRRSILIGSTLVSLSCILRSFAYNFETLFLSVSLMGFGGPAISVGIPKAVASWFVGKDRGTASGFYFTGFIMGVATATAITNKLIMHFFGVWRGALAFYGIFGFIAVLIWLIFAKEKSHDYLNVGSMGSVWEGLGVLLQERDIWMVAIVGFSSFFVRHSLGGWLPKMLELKGMSPERAGLIASFPSWVGLIGSLSIPRFSEKQIRKYVISFALLVQGVCTYVMGTTLGFPLVISLVFYGLSTYAILPLLMVTLMGLKRVGVDYMGVAGGLFFSIGEVGGFLGPAVLGLLLDATGSTLPGIILLTIVVEAMIIVTLLMRIE